ncbi:MAG: hypothetical protein JWN27_1970 [Candidatus Eremiobacteraeota bacterium]|nr:hypothetical protein [Candidatus Eremiobacteraeota bacterium]
MRNDTAVVDETIDSIAELERRMLADASHHQRAIELVTQSIGRPRALYLAIAFLLAWIAGNIVALAMTHTAPDPPPFAWLALTCTVGSFLMTFMILISANRGDALDEQRDRLSLQIALLTDRKTAKIISLLEELRRDLPSVRNRVDNEASELSQATDPHAVSAELDKRTPNLSDSFEK